MNVLVAANENSEQADPECQIRCIDELLAIKNREILVLDADAEILDEYARHCCRSGEPGVGDQFFRWASETAHTIARQ